jgi:hypothetical protein
MNQYQDDVTVNIKESRDRRTPQSVDVIESKTGRDKNCRSPLHKNRRGLEDHATCNIVFLHEKLGYKKVSISTPEHQATNTWLASLYLKCGFSYHRAS